MRGPIRVLHVDDEPGFADLVADFLERTDDRFEVVTEVGAEAGLDRLSAAEDRIDCVVSDYDMPGMDGLDFLEAVRADRPDLPFVLFTGKGSEEVASEAISAGATDYLQKGGGTEQYDLLANRVRNAVEQYRSAEQAAETKRRLQELAESTTDCLWMFDRDWEELLFVSGYEEIWDRPTEAIRENPRDFLDGADPADRELVEDAMARLSAGESIDIEYRIQRGTDDPGWVWVKGEPVYEDGEVARVVGFTRDITDRKRRERRLQRQHDAILDLATDEAVVNGDFETAVRRITERAADVLDVPRANVWLFDDAEVLECVDHYDADADEHDAGMELVAGDYPAYFEALAANRAIAAEDAHADPRTAGLEEYLAAHDVEALLDGTLRSEGEVVGVVCHEHVGGEREWTDDEIRFASDVADVVYRALRNHERTERRREIERQRSLLAAQRATVPDGMLVVDDGEIVSYNEQFAEMWGIPEPILADGDEAALEWATERVADPEAFRREAERLYDNPAETSRDEVELADGRVFDRYSAPVVGDDGTRFGRLWTFRDVTAERERERELERERAFIEQALDALEEVFYVVGPDGRLRRWNDRLSEVTGYSDAEIEEMAAVEFFPGEQRDRIAGAIEEALSTGNAIVEADLLTADGERIPYEFTGARLTDQDGSTVGIIGIGRDLTGREAYERRLADQRCRLEQLDRINRTILSVHRCLVGTTDRETIERNVPERLTETDVYEGAWIGRYDPDGERIVPVAWSSGLDDEHFEALELPTDETPRGRGPAGEAIRDRRVRTVSDVATAESLGPWRDRLLAQGIESLAVVPIVHEDTVYGLVGVYANRASVFTDDEREALSGLGRSIGNAFATAEMHAELERQNDRLEAFASIVSHDLRNPLNVADGRLELARADCDSEHLDHVSDALDRMNGLIEDVLALAREGGAANGTEPVGIRDLAEGCWGTVGTADATLVVADDPTIEADPGRLRRLLENLFRNAIEHGGPDVTVTVGGLPDGFYVADDGRGVPADDREAVFESGYSTAADGTGFGLAIVREITDAHGWEVDITESDGGGARFEITGTDG